jgi:two-component system, OmpR family, alkaline phosphatase synthesis response regulator PhoP
MSHVLIADDDADLVEGLRWYLEAEDFRVTTVSDGEAALEAVRKEQPDVVILDVMMPGIDGITACGIIRGESDVFIMMLSARDGELDKVRALSTGADDYLTKPFSSNELVARIHALLRRAHGQRETPAYRWKGLNVLLEERRVLVDGAEVELTAMEFDLLAALLQRPRVVFSREQLVSAIWNDDFYGELRLVDNHVYRLREKLTKAGLENCPIVTVRGAGYAFRPED